MPSSEYQAPARTLGVPVPKPKKHKGRVSVLLTRRLTNLPIRVPSTDWAAVATGQKRMFRTYGLGRDRALPVVPPDTACPRPVLLFTARHDGPRRSRRWEATPGVLVAHRQEPLGTITPEDLETEGFSGLPAFRYYWKQRHVKLGWRPWDMVSVLEVRPWTRYDRDEFADWAIRQLYVDWFDDRNDAHCQ